MSENTKEVCKNNTKTKSNKAKTNQKNNKSFEWQLKGIVNCNKLHLRKDSNKESESLKILEMGEKLSINEKKSTDDFYYVRMKNNKKGYCMKKFITVI